MFTTGEIMGLTEWIIDYKLEQKIPSKSVNISRIYFYAQSLRTRCNSISGEKDKKTGFEDLAKTNLEVGRLSHQSFKILYF